MDIFGRKVCVNGKVVKSLSIDGAEQSPDYFLLDFIKSQGDIEIVTGWVPKINPRVVMKFMKHDGDKDYFGLNSRSVPMFCGDLTNGGYYLRYYSTTSFGLSGGGLYNDVWYNFEFGNEIYVDGMLRKVCYEQIPDWSINDLPMKVFGGRTGLSAKASFSFFKGYEGDELVLDLYPVMRVADRVIGFVDKINRVFYPTPTGIMGQKVGVFSFKY